MKVGDYVRTRDGFIGKINNIKKDERIHLYQDSIYTDNYKWLDLVLEESIIKSSPNIIDLIEVGDYVNGDRVKALKGDIESHKINNEEDVIYTEYINDYDEWCGYEEDEIKSIVTKEQFESMEYKI